VTSAQEIRLRWAPTDTKAWLDGRKYGYRIERYTLLKDSVWQEKPEKKTIDETFNPKPIGDWEIKANESDYAAVIAQAFYGDEFSLNSPSSDVGSIINQATELEQRFTTSVFMAEYDYEAAKLAGWAWVDKEIQANEKYLYRIYLNRPKREAGDTAVVYIGMDDRRELPKPIGLNTVFGDKSVLLSWNYKLLSDFYHSYHIERKTASEENFERITDLPVTVLDADMQEIFYTDSLANNETEYIYRVIGLTSFDELSPVSDMVRGNGKETASCIPQILSGYFTGEDKAHIFWEFECLRIGLVSKLQIKHSSDIDGDYTIIEDSISLHLRDYPLLLHENINYIKVLAINNDGSKNESFPFQLNKTDSIPPAIPTGLNIIIDSVGVAHLAWTANVEPDLRGYRILRSFTKEGEKSPVAGALIKENHFTDTLSLQLSNPKVYYSLTAVDMRYNESPSCPEVIAEKPNKLTLTEPVITGYEIDNNKVTITWLTNPNMAGIKYSLVRTVHNKPQYNKTIFEGDSINTYTDRAVVSGEYQYTVIAYGLDGNKSYSPKPLVLDIKVSEARDEVAGFNSYIDRNNGYIELSWKKNPLARAYRIYKTEEGKKTTLWKEVDGATNRIVDEHLSLDTKYTYSITFISDEGQTSKPKSLIVNY